MRLKKKYFLIFIVFSTIFYNSVCAQHSLLDVGVRVQKTVNLYWENGFSIQYSNRNVKPDNLYFGFSYISSRLGSAFISNAIKQDYFLLNTSWYFRKQHVLRPLVRLNLGYFMADYEEPFFDDLTNTSLVISPEAGLIVDTKSPLKIMITLGYNVITGDGEQGAGTLYPLFIQTTISWTLLRQ